jgi:hypothetical protein
MNSVMWSTAVIRSVRADSLLCTEKYEISEIKNQRIWTYSMHEGKYVLVGRDEAKKYLGDLGVDARTIEGHCFIGQLASTIHSDRFARLQRVRC